MIKKIIAESVGKLFIAHNFNIQQDIMDALTKGDSN